MTDSDDDDEWISRVHLQLTQGLSVDAPLTVGPQRLAEVRHCLEQLEGLRRQRELPNTVATTIAHLLDDPLLLNGITSHIGRYELRRELGRGAHGVVLLAFDPVHQREVAIKVPRLGMLTSLSLRERFLREGQVAALLHHPNILPVYEVGQLDRLDFIVFAYCPGPNLATWLAERPTPIPADLAARITVQLALGIEHAHQHGVLHRDLKPSNVLLMPVRDGDAEDEFPFLAQLTDFGLARLTEGNRHQTHEGTILGTPNYMAPEQALAQDERIGKPTDVYGLGAILYELMTGAPPYRGTDLAEIRNQMATQQLVSPRRLNPAIPADLAAICLRCLASDPDSRYPTATELITDLNRYLNHKRTIARPLNRWWQFCQRAWRHPGSVMSTALIVALIGLSSILMWRTSVVRARAIHQADRFRFAADMQIAEQETQANLRESVLNRLSAYPTDDRLRSSFVWQYLWNVNQQEWRTYLGHSGPVRTVEYAPDGSRFASGGDDGTVRIWDAGADELLQVMKERSDEVCAVRWSPDGRQLASISLEGTIRIWDIPAGTINQTLQTGHANREAAAAIDFSSDGKFLVAGHGPNCLVWRTDTWSQLQAFRESGIAFASLDISPDSSVLAAGDDHGVLRIWELTTGKLVRRERLTDGVTTICRLRFSDDGQLLYCLFRESSFLACHEMHSGATRQIHFRHSDWHADFLLIDPHLLITSGKFGNISFWSPSRIGPARSLNGHDGPIWALSGSPNRAEFVSAGADGKIKLWTIHDPFHQTYECSQPIESLDFLADGRQMIAASSAPSLFRVDMETTGDIVSAPLECAKPDDSDGNGPADKSSVLGDGRDRPSRDNDSAAPCPIGWNERHEVLIQAKPADNDCLRMWSQESGKLLRTFRFPGPVTTWDAARSVPLIAVSYDNVVEVVDGDSQQLRQRFQEHAPQRVHLAHRGQYLATVDSRDQFLVRSISDGKAILSSKLSSPPAAIAFSTSDQQIAVAVHDIINVYDLKLGSKNTLAGHTDPVLGIAFAPDDRFLASCGADGTVRLWDLQCDQQVLQLSADSGSLRGVRFSSDGTRLAAWSAGTPATIHVWRCSPPEQKSHRGGS
ncbi:MAG: protein kinase [Pirellulales bacterium]